MSYLFALLAVVVVSLISLVGVLFFFLRKEIMEKVAALFVSLSAGSLLGGAFLHLLPEALEKRGNTESIWFALFGGLLSFFVLEKIICWRHCHIPTSREHPHHLGMMNLIGDGLHNLMDGIIIAAAFLIDLKLGLATTIAVIFHEIPQEISDFGVLVYAGWSRVRALIFNLLSALAAILGALLVFALETKAENIIPFLIPFTAGGFIYIATADLIPELKKETNPKKSALQLLSILSGFILMALFKKIMK